MAAENRAVRRPTITYEEYMTTAIHSIGMVFIWATYLAHKHIAATTLRDMDPVLLRGARVVRLSNDIASYRSHLERKEGRFDGVRLEVEGGHMALEVVDRHERQAARERQRLRGREAHQERADQAGPLGHGHRLEVVEPDARVGQRTFHGRHDQLQVPARGHLGHDTAVRRVQGGLRGNDVREDGAAPRHDRRGGLIARRLDPEDHTGGSASFHMMSASSRLSV